MKKLAALGFASALLMVAGSPAMASDEATAEDIEKINALLAGIQCEMDEDDIEKEDDGFELDDVLCVDGQFDIDLDSDFNIVEKRAE